MASFLKISLALLLLPTLVHGQVRTKKSETSAVKAMSQESLRRGQGDIFAGIATLTIIAVNDAGDRSTEFAPSLAELQGEVKEVLIKKLSSREVDESSRKATGLPATVRVGINAFLSRTGDVIYSLRVALERPVCILGTTEVVDALLRQYVLVGRIDRDSARDEILKGITGLAERLGDEYLAHDSKLIEKGGRPAKRPAITIVDK